MPSSHWGLLITAAVTPLPPAHPFGGVAFERRASLLVLGRGVARKRREHLLHQECPRGLPPRGGIGHGSADRKSVV